MVYHLGANEVEEVNGADPAVIARTHELLEPMFPDATYTLETVDTVYIQGPHEGGEVLEAPAWWRRKSPRRSNVSVQPRSLST